MFVVDSKSTVIKLTVLELETHLLGKEFSEKTTNVLRENDIDGDVLLTLEENQLQSLGISLGQRVKLVRYIKSLSMGTSHSTVMDPTILHHFESPSSGTVTPESQLWESHLQTSLNDQLVDNNHQMEDLLGSSTSRDPLPFSFEKFSEPVPTASDSNLQNHVPPKVCEKNLTFDVKEILNAHEEGKKIVEKYQADVAMPVTEVDRNTIINIALGHVIRTIGNYYPEASTKQKLAAAIVAAFPQMGLIRDGLPAYTYIYNSATGNAYIDQHLKRMRKAALTPDQRKRKSVEKPKDDARKGKGKSLKKSSPAEQPLSDEYVAECKSKVAWLQNCGVFLENKSKIMEYMDETYEYRRYQIANILLTPTAIVTEFPRFLDVDFGRLIIADYVHQYPKTSDIGTFMSKYGNRLIRLALYNNMEIQESTDAFLKVLVVCVKLMPRIQQAKSQLNTTLQQLVIFLKENTNLEEFVKNKPKHLKQPFLVCLGTLIAPKQFFLVVDFYVIDCGSECSNAFNVLFSSFFAFNTEYPKPVLMEFYQFFEYAVYGIVPSCSCNIGAFVSKLECLPLT